MEKKGIQSWFAKISRMASSDIGIDLGTANTLVYVKGKGIVINEPSVVAVNQKTGQVVAVGNEAKKMLGRTPAHITAVRPLVDGVISDFEVTQEMLSYLINKAQKDETKFFGPRVVIGVPSGITNVEIRAVRDAAKGAGAREVFIVEEPMASAIGIGLPVYEAVGSMIVDIGGGTSDIAVIALNGVVNSRNLRIAGDKLNNDIISFIRDQFQVLIGERTAEAIKISLASVWPTDEGAELSVRGRDLVTGLPREIVITDTHVKDAITNSIDTLVESIKEVLETTPPEVVSDVMRRGIFLVGGGALIRGLDELLSEWLKVPVYVDPDPLTSVVRGTGSILENMDRFSEVIIENDDAISPKN